MTHPNGTILNVQLPLLYVSLARIYSFDPGHHLLVRLDLFWSCLQTPNKLRCQWFYGKPYVIYSKSS